MNVGGVAYDARQPLKLNDGELRLKFSAPPADPGISAMKNLVNVAPAPPTFSYRLDGNDIVVGLGLELEKLYKITLNPTPMKDRAGRALTNKKPCSFFAYQPKPAPVARWERGSGIVERFGPQHFPIRAQGTSSLDFRIYKVDPMHHAFSQFPSSQIEVRESTAPPGPGEEPARMDSASSRYSRYSYTSDVVKHIMMLGSPHYSAVVDLEKEGINKFQTVDLKPMLASAFGKEKAGTYLVGFRQLDGSDRRYYARVDVTDLCLSAVESKRKVMFAVTSYSSGKAVSDVSISIDGIVKNKMTTLAQGKTGSDGTFTLEHTSSLAAAFKNAMVRRVVASKGDDALVLDVREGSHITAQVFANNHWYGGGEYDGEWLGWFNSKVYSSEQDSHLRGFVRTERPIYRPEDSVFIKGYVRETMHGAIKWPTNNAGEKYVVRVHSPSQKFVDYPVRLNEFGSFDLKVFSSEQATGIYEVSLLQLKSQQRSLDVASTDFAVEAYRIPRFDVRMSGAERVPNDGPAEVRATASYYAGGRVVDRDIAWKVTSYPYDHRPRGFANYILSSDGRYGAVAERRRQSVLEENGKTDENGSAAITLNPQAATDGNPMKYVVEATVTDADKQTVSSRHTVVALPPFILGVRANRHITSGSAISARVAAIGVNDSLIAGQKVNVELKRVTWASYLADSDFSSGKPKYITDETVELVEEKAVVTGKEPTAVEFKNRQPGVYILELSSRDRLGRLQTVRVDLYLAGGGAESQTWKKAEQNLFETVTDRNSYEPGQQAKILLKSPYKKAIALAVAEMPNGEISYKWVDIANGEGTFTLEIKQEMAPKIPVSFLLMRPRAAVPRRTADGVQVDAGKPETVGNTTWLTVNPVANMLDVKLTHAQTVMPGATLDVTVSLKDIQGKALGGEVALWLVDEAVLSLRKERSLDPLEAFLEEVQSHVTLRDSRNLALGDLLTRENPGGGGGDMENDGALGKITPRKNFKTVPYWNPSIKVDKNGTVIVKIPMSDDLTNYSVRAMAVSGPDKFGAAKTRVSVRLPVTVQPALPRFVRLGDKLRAGGIARVVEGGGGAASWSIDAKGLNVKNTPNKQIQLDGVKPMPLYADLEVQTPPFTQRGRLQWDSVTVKMAVMRNSDKAGDAFEVKIPVLPDRQYIEETQFSQLDKGKSFAWPALSKPARANTVSGNIIVSDNQYLPKIISAMASLVRYPYGCTEQVVSQSYPSIVYNDLWNKYGIDSPDPSVAESVRRAVEFLKTAQHTDGLFGYWPGAPGYVYLTAYAVDFLTEVKNANKNLKQPFAFDQTMYGLAVEALKRSLRSDYSRFVSGHSAYERACALSALAKSGHLDIGYARELAAAARDMDVLGKANVLKAVSGKQDALGSEYAMLEDQLWKSTVFTERQGAEMFGGFQRHSSPIGARMHVTDAATLASFVSAVSPRGQSKNQRRIALMTDELIKMGADDGWGSTYANSLSLLALREYLDSKESASSNTFKLNDGDRSQQLTMQGALSTYWSSGKAGDISATGQSANRAFWVRLSRRYVPQALGSAAEPEQRGFSVKREIIRMKKGAPPEKFAIDKGNTVLKLKSGDIIEEHIQVVNSETRLFVAVSAPIAAGFEPLNPRLENASSDARPSNRSTNEGDFSAFFDDRVVYFFERMEQGTYDFYFRTQALTEGEFSHPPAKAEMMYQMSVYGASAGAKAVVSEK
jgi:uncharacterized protein YfaS (alpha-2-macroglobulin family)